MSPPAASTFVASRRIGEAVVTVISEGSCLWAPRYQVPEPDWRRCLADADTGGRIRIGFNLVHVALAGASVVIDPGFDDPGTPWDEAFGARWAGYSRTPGMMAALAAIGVRADDVTHVLITHTHDDHFAGVTREERGHHRPRFARARHFVGRADWERAPRRGDPGSDLMVRLGTIERAGALTLVDGETDVAPGATMVHAPGETAGHCIVRVTSRGEAFYFAGDLFHHRCEIEHPGWVSPHRDPAVMQASRARLIAEAARTRATVVFAHEAFPAWGRISVRGPDARWERLA
jgi:glyoxylase-like metal-dependent hydrolase (beta-lactamase superfamily II)